MAAKRVTAEQLGLDRGIARAHDAALFKWLIASFLFGKPIQQGIATEAYRVIVEQHQRDTPRKLGNCSKAELVHMLGQAHYVRYDNSTAERLVKLCRKLLDEYGGKLSNLREQSADRDEFEQRLRTFDGIGPKTVEIFMREAAPALY
ncbi:DNA methylase [Phytopseudomonas daroniae]|uniref:DNA methylase n=1 Tax=Phytopseudomonas daroniae TaxID=2487519 RepID=UPI0010385B53|nr:DNA methylase [Pseudomonas daroniae]TBU72846.1 DNA methylase [Pseudomonas daroniae]